MESKIYTVTNIKDLLNISRTKAYEYVKKFIKKESPLKLLKLAKIIVFQKQALTNG